MILLSDANVLIDLGYVGGIPVLPQIAPTEVLDVVLMECEDERQPVLLDAVRAAGIEVIDTERQWLEEARAFKSAELSVQDRLNLYYAKRFGRVLLATDRPLRERCQHEGVDVHGTLWLVREALGQSLVTSDELCRWLRVWPTVGSRLPPEEVRKLQGLLEC